MSAEAHEKLSFSCHCGQISGHLSTAGRSSGTRLDCYCSDCRAAELWAGEPDPRPGGVRIFHTGPEHVHFERGAEHLIAMRLGPNGLIRWFAGCCNAPICGTTAKPALPFVGLAVGRFAQPEALGKARVQVHRKGTDGKPRNKGMGTLALGIFKRLISSRLSGTWKQTPFFDVETGKPIVEPVILSKEERRAIGG